MVRDLKNCNFLRVDKHGEMRYLKNCNFIRGKIQERQTQLTRSDS